GGGVPALRITILLNDRGVDFDVKDDFVQQVRKGGGTDALLKALQSAKVTKPNMAVDPALEAQHSDVRQHMAHGAELANKGQLAPAEQEYRAALQIDPQNADLYVSLAFILIQEQRWDDAAEAERSAIRLDPNNDFAHNNLGVALGTKGYMDPAITEFRE